MFFIDLVTGQITQVGPFSIVTVPGLGAVVIDTGRIVWDGFAGNVTFEAGPHDAGGFFGPGAADLLCEALA
jgi:hypothetical protein